jgi:Spy/CpxP family protein refolding chaperone
MKKTLVVVAVALVALTALAVAGFAYAQSQTPPSPDNPNGAYGPGMMRGWGGRGMMNGPGMMGGDWANGSYGPMHAYMLPALAEALDLAPEDLQARIDAGESPWQIAQAQGLSDEEVSALLSEAHAKALQSAVEAGAITQEQADWMQDHMQQRWQNGAPGFGPCHGGAGRGSRGRWNSLPEEPSA